MYNRHMSISRKIKRRKYAGILFFASALLLFACSAPAVSAEEIKTYPEQVKPVLAVPIPDLQFSDIIIDENQGTIDIPFIADYISALYKYAIGVAAVLATVMIMIGGLQYLMAGGDATRVGNAKKRITDAMIGLLLSLGTYMILAAVNPDLVSLKNIRVQLVEEVLFPETLATTQQNTVGLGASGAIAGTHTPTFTTCPISFTVNKEEVSAYRDEFYKKVGAVITASDPGERVVQVADAADICDVKLGSCGNTTGTITALAGIGNTNCFKAGLGACGSNRGKQTHAITKEHHRETLGRRCEIPDNHKKYLKDPCTTSNREATAYMRDYFKKEAAEGRLEGWPDAWANALKPGDTLIVYNGNKSLAGTHAVIFVGWGSGGRAQVIQSQFRDATRPGSLCIKSECGDKMVPITKTYTPQ